MFTKLSLIHTAELGASNHDTSSMPTVHCALFKMAAAGITKRLSTGGPDVVFNSSADKTMYENTLNTALNRTCIKDLNENVLHYVYLTLF